MTTLLVKMRGELEPERISGEFKETITEFQLAAAGGKSFMLCADPDDEPLALRLDNIISIKRDPKDAF